MHPFLRIYVYVKMNTCNVFVNEEYFLAYGFVILIREEKLLRFTHRYVFVNTLNTADVKNNYTSLLHKVLFGFIFIMHSVLRYYVLENKYSTVILWKYTS